MIPDHTAGHLSLSGEFISFPHYCPGEECAIRMWMERKYRERNAAKGDDYVIESEAADGTVDSDSARLTTRSEGGNRMALPILNAQPPISEQGLTWPELVAAELGKNDGGR